MRMRGTGIVLLLLAACSGRGSDIGPRIEPVPDAAYEVLVHDDAGRAVTGATVTVGDGGERSVTVRSGRADFRGRPSGRLPIAVDPRAAAAGDGDALVPVTVAADTPTGGELPFVLHVPDVAPSNGATLPPSPSTTVVLDDSTAPSGAVVTVAAGTAVTTPGGGTIVLRTGLLQPGHLPGGLPAPGTGARLGGRGVSIAPAALTLSPGADLTVPDDLGLAAGAPADLYHLDPDTGEWSRVGTGTVDTGGTTITAAGLVTAGGTYAFATGVPATAVASGRIVDRHGAGVPGVLVRADQVHGRTAGNGTFRLEGAPAADGSGAARSVTVEYTAGAGWWPISGSATATPAGGVADFGERTLDTEPVGRVRMLQVTRGEREPGRRIGVGAVRGLIGRTSLGDGNGETVFEDIGQGFIGFHGSHPRPDLDEHVFVRSGARFVPHGRDQERLTVFSRELDWQGFGRSTRVWAIDRHTLSPVEFVEVAQGSVPGEGYRAPTGLDGSVIADKDVGGEATAAFESSSDGRTVVSAFSMVDPFGIRAELPIERATRAPLGSFDRHAVVGGELTGATGGKDHRLRTTRRLARGDWVEEVFQGLSRTGDLPVDIDPQTTGGTGFRVGVADPEGNVAAVEGSTSSGIFTFERLGLAVAVEAAPGEVLARDIALSHAAGTVFSAPEAMLGRDPALPLADLRFDLAYEAADRRVVDVVRGVGGNHTVAGADASFTLPALSGSLAGGTWLVAFGGSGTDGSDTIEQRSLLRFDGAEDPVVRLLPVPDLVTPVDGATVPETGFPVEFSLPPSALYAEIELRASSGGTERVWRVLLPAYRTSYSFRELPAPLADPLVAGETYTLTVTAVRLGDGPLLRHREPYIAMTSHFVGIDLAERGLQALARRSITVTAN